MAGPNIVRKSLLYVLLGNLIHLELFKDFVFERFQVFEYFYCLKIFLRERYISWTTFSQYNILVNRVVKGEGGE